jgi:hypothetical protein
MELTNMETRKKKILKALTVILAFSFAQVYVQAGLPTPVPGAPLPQRAISARLITPNNQPITVNGNPVGTGGTILTGATIETPDQFGATIDLGEAGVVELQPGAKVQLDYDENGNVRVKVMRGCAVTKKKSNVLPGEMEIYTDTASEKTDKNRKHMGFCFLPATGGLAAISGAAAGAGAGLSGAAIAAIVAGGTAAAVVTAVVVTRGNNNSPSQ